MRTFKNTHWLTAFCWFVLAGSSALMSPGCGAIHDLSAQATPPGGSSWVPMPTPLGVDMAEGTVEMKTQADAQGRTVPSDGSLAAVTNLRVTAGRGAIFSMGSATHSVGRLWLQTGTQLRVGGDGNGGYLLDVQRGQARWSLFQGQRRARVLSVDGWQDVTGGDVLVVRRTLDSASRVLPTSQHVAQADWSLALQSATQTSGMGSLQVRGTSNNSYLQLNALTVDARTAGDRVALRVEHVFHNPTPERMEGTFRFPLPDGAILTGLAMDVNGELMQGEIVEREKARKVYQGIVDSMRDPAILEWEDGNTFKLRIFPIEPNSDKHVVLEYLATPDWTPDGAVFQYTSASPAFQDRIPQFVLRVDGVERVRRNEMVGGQQWRIPLSFPRQKAVAVRQRQEDGSALTAVRVVPTWSRTQPAKPPIPSPTPGKKRRVLVWVDTSRSALESYDMALASAERLLETLSPEQSFLVVASDITTRSHADEFEPVSTQAVARSLAFLQGIDPDGASDLVGAMETVAGLAGKGSAATDVVYIGDGAATWGIVDEDALQKSRLIGAQPVRLSAMLLGRNAVKKAVSPAAQQSGGIVGRPRSVLDVDRFLLRWQTQLDGPRLAQCTLHAGEGHVVQDQPPVSLFPGDHLEALVYTPPGASAMTTMTLRCNGDKTKRRLTLNARKDGQFVGQRWAAAEIARLQKDKENKAKVVQLSETHGVLSKYTAFLVLESEEAYRQHNIERRRGPNVSGADLESVDRQASLSPNHIQPGDPEIQVPAPADARSVVVVFPFGVTKIARYEADLSAWTVRFLIDKSTPDGVYFALVRITHADGRVEVLRLPYSVDTQAPTVKVTVRKSRWSRNAYIVTARQLAKDVELARVLPAWNDSNQKDRLRKRYARLVMDAARVEVRMPDGQRIRLKRKGDGRFRAVWRPNGPVEDGASMTIVAVDVPGNRAVFEQSVEMEGGRHE